MYESDFNVPHLAGRRVKLNLDDSHCRVRARVTLLYEKVELHVHLDGAFDPALLLSYLKSSESSYASLPLEAFCPWDQSTIPVR